mgnify:CR=1 FL=1
MGKVWMRLTTNTPYQGDTGEVILSLLAMLILYVLISVVILTLRDLLFKLFNNKSESERSKRLEPEDVLKRYEMWQKKGDYPTNYPTDAGIGCSGCNGCSVPE